VVEAEPGGNPNRATQKAPARSRVVACDGGTECTVGRLHSLLCGEETRSPPSAIGAKENEQISLCKTLITVVEVASHTGSRGVNRARARDRDLEQKAEERLVPLGESRVAQFVCQEDAGGQDNRSEGFAKPPLQSFLAWQIRCELQCCVESVVTRPMNRKAGRQGSSTNADVGVVFCQETEIVPPFPWIQLPFLR